MSNKRLSMKTLDKQRIRAWTILSVVGGAILSLILGLYPEQRMYATDNTLTRGPYDGRIFPGDLICDAIPMVNEGPIWMGIEIGVTTLPEFRSFLAELNPHYRQIDDDRLLFIPWGQEDDQPWITVCVLDDTISTLGLLYIATYPKFNLSDFVARYGTPDVIAWTSNPPATRSAFWFEHGVAVEFGVIEGTSFGGVFRVVYFPYQSADGYETRWPYNRTISGDTVNMEKLYGTLNPFDFDAMLATITAQPSRTPTPTFTPRSTRTMTPPPSATITPTPE